MTAACATEEICVEWRMKVGLLLSRMLCPTCTQLTALSPDLRRFRCGWNGCRIERSMEGFATNTATDWFSFCRGVCSKEMLACPIQHPIAVYPLVTTVPYGYIVTEPLSAFPQDGGFTIRVMHAVGALQALQAGTGPGTLKSGVEEYWIKLAVAVVLTLPALAGTKTTAHMCITLTALVLLPFAIFSPGGDVSILWGLLINALLWKFGGFHMASFYCGEVKDRRACSRGQSLSRSRS
ncbi:hypothetical protein PybrP1_010871 [[Pythium] brassicae (nom. inval.)]|nr:hypothetical protein PybrP1_010871 [[Pythium] brassicae (nom. inval.)]